MNTISVCIPTYNQSIYLEKAVRSAWMQSRKPDEIIVFDDASTDQTAEVLKGLVKEIPVLHFFTQLKNKGISENVEGCLRAATGKYIVRLDSDDVLHQDYLKKMIFTLDAHEQAGYGHCAIQEIDERDNPTRLRTLARKGGFEPAEQALKKAVSGYRVSANIITYRKTALEELNFNLNRPNYTEDYHLSVAMAAAGYGNVYLDELLASYRIWVDAGMMRQRRKLLEISGLVKVYKEAIIPAFQKRAWEIKPVLTHMGKKARRQAVCLGWDVYTLDEKKELLQSLRALSDTSYSNFIYSLHLKGYGGIYKMLSNTKNLPKKLLKRILFR